MDTLSIVLVIALIVIAWVICMFNNFKRTKVMIAEAWSSIDVQLKRKANIVLNLVDLLKMQMGFESKVLQELTNARSRLTSRDHTEAMKANDSISKILPSVYAVSENYPVLKTSESFLETMREVKDCDDKVAYARNRYNMAVAKMNASIQVFPSNIVASMFGFKEEKLFEMSEPPREVSDNLRIGKLDVK